MIKKFWICVTRVLLWLRYRVRLKGLDEIQARGRRGILFLPNHPALIDPIIMVSRLAGPLNIHTLGDRNQIDRFLVRNVAGLFNVIPIDDASTQEAAPHAIRKVIDSCVDVLRRNENLLMYPAGNVLRTMYEEIGANSGVETILSRLPDIRVVLVRTTGLWGSGFSWAGGTEPDVAKMVAKGFWKMLANGLFFSPRREVTIEFVEPDDLPRTADRNTINRYLENFYNETAKPNTYVPYTIWESGHVRQLPEPTPLHIEGDPGETPPATRQIVRDYLAELTGMTQFEDSSKLATDLGMDSLAGMELVTWLQHEFGFPLGSAESLKTVGDVMLAACGQSVSAGPVTLEPVNPKWFSKIPTPNCPPDAGNMTILDAFLYQAGRFPDKSALADQASGVKTYRDIILGALALHDFIKKIPGDVVGIMMPASVGATVMYFATLFAGKTPAMINWTLGPKNIHYCMESVKVQRILTAKALLSRVQSQGIDLTDLQDRFVFIEQVGKDMGRVTKLKALFRSRLSWRILRQAGRETSPDSPAVILFTSGSESLPKAVPLSHRNIMTNVADCHHRFTPEPGDVMIGILPPFHSFGLTASVMLSLCSGIRAVYYPNPTDGGTLGRIIEMYKGTILAGTPTFLHGIVRASTSQQLATLRLVVSGAETCSPHVYQAVENRCPQTVVMEGYGATECSPVIAVNNAAQPHKGTIGRIMPSLSYVLTDPDVNAPARPGCEGMLLVRGPSVFHGYLNHKGDSPFVEFQGLTWYRTGDLVFEDADGILTFAGRLKRFIKLGGEMISLPAIEAVLEPLADDDSDDGPTLAVIATAGETPEIILVSTKSIDRETANLTIRGAGLSGLHNIRRTVQITELPLLGTGKIDYRTLQDKLPTLLETTK